MLNEWKYTKLKASARELTSHIVRRDETRDSVNQFRAKLAIYGRCGDVWDSASSRWNSIVMLMLGKVKASWTWSTWTHYQSAVTFVCLAFTLSSDDRHTRHSSCHFGKNHNTFDVWPSNIDHRRTAVHNSPESVRSTSKLVPTSALDFHRRCHQDECWLTSRFSALSSREPFGHSVMRGIATCPSRGSG